MPKLTVRITEKFAQDIKDCLMLTNFATKSDLLRYLLRQWMEKTRAERRQKTW